MAHLEKSRNIFTALLEIQKRGEKACLITVVETSGSTPRETGARMIVKANGDIINTIGGGRVEQLIIQDAYEVMRTGRSILVDYSLDQEKGQGKTTGMICGGAMKFFIENIQTFPNLYIFGSGHIGQVMYQLGLFSHFNVFLADDRREFASPEKFPEASQIFTGPYEDIVPQIQFHEPAYAVIMTESHEIDEIVLEACLKKKKGLQYLGMVASKAKMAEIKERLSDKGFSPEDLDFITAPAGIPIMSKAPEEIALSIMAEIIKIKNTKGPMNNTEEHGSS